MTLTKKLYGVIISSFILVIMHYLMYLFNPSTWDLALKPGNLKAINFITAFFAHLNDNHLYSNLISFVLLALSCKKKIISVWFVFLVSGWIGNLCVVIFGESMVLGFSGGLVGLSVLNVFYNTNRIGLVISLFYIMITFSYIYLQKNNVSHYAHIGGFIASLLIVSYLRFKEKSSSKKI